MARIIPDFSELTDIALLDRGGYEVGSSFANTLTQLVLTVPRAVFQVGVTDGYSLLDIDIDINDRAFYDRLTPPQGAVPAMAGTTYAPTDGGQLRIGADVAFGADSGTSWELDVPTYGGRSIKGVTPNLIPRVSPSERVQLVFPKALMVDRGNTSPDAIKMYSQEAGATFIEMTPMPGIGDDVTFVDFPLLEGEITGYSFASNGVATPLGVCCGFIKRSATLKHADDITEAEVIWGWLVKGPSAKFCRNGVVLYAADIGTDVVSIAVHTDCDFYYENPDYLGGTAEMYLNSLWVGHKHWYPGLDPRDIGRYIYSPYVRDYWRDFVVPTIEVGRVGGASTIYRLSEAAGMPRVPLNLSECVMGCVFGNDPSNDVVADQFDRGYNDVHITFFSAHMIYYPSPAADAQAFWAQRVRSSETI